MSNTFVGIMITALLLIISISALGINHQFLVKSYLLGRNPWSQLISSVAAISFMLLIGANLASGSAIKNPWINLFNWFSPSELLLFFVFSLLIFSKYANLTSVMILVYLSVRLLTKYIDQVPPVGLTFLFANLSVLVILGDHLPWINLRNKAPYYFISNDQIREGSLICLGVTTVFFSLLCITKISSLSSWLGVVVNHSLPTSLVLFALLMTIAGWICILLNLAFSPILSILSLPTTIVIYFVTNGPRYLSVIPFVLCLALSLVQFDRRRKILIFI